MLFALIFPRAQRASTYDISAERNVWLQSALRSFAIVCDYMETGLFAIVCDPRSSAIVCDRLRSFAIIWKPAITDTSTSSTEVCYLDTNIKTGGTSTPFRNSICDKRDDFTFRIVNFPHMDSNIPANPAYGVYISQLVRYVRICTSKVDFMNRLRGLSLRLRQQDFLTNLLLKSFNKFFNRHGLLVVKYGATLREMRLAIHA